MGTQKRGCIFWGSLENAIINWCKHIYDLFIYLFSYYS